MTAQLPIFSGQKGGVEQSRLLIICPLADIYSGVGNFGAPPLGPWRLCHYLQKHGQHVDVWDCNVSENLRLPSPEDHQGRDRGEVLAEAFAVAIEADFNVGSYEWIGFSVLSDTLPTTLGAIELIKKKYPNIKLIGGNHEATVNLQDCIGRSKLDAVILADAEEPMLKLMRGEEPSKIPGVLWRNFNPKPSRENFEEWNDSIRWGEIPYAEYWNRTAALYPLDSMSEEERLEKLYEIKTVRVHSLVACELACSFCSVKTTRRWASGSNKPSIINLSPDALARNLIAIKKQVPEVMTIYDSCDEAWLGKGRGEEYCAVLESIKPVMDRGLPRGIRYLIQCRTNDLHKNLIEYAARAGVKHLTIGVESPVEQVRRDMIKPQQESHIRDSIRWGTECGIQMYLLFIAFFPTITLEQLYEAVENWRIYMNLGATVSIEPFCMSYLGTDLHDDPRFFTEYVGYTIPFSGGKKLKWATLIWPTDRRVCAILQWCRANLDRFIEEARKKVNHKHAYKGFVGRIFVECLEYALKLWEQEKIPPWEPGEGIKSAVYQDFGDQMSGAEVAAAARSLDRRTTTRFNSTHSLLDSKVNTHDDIEVKSLIDDPNAGIKGRIKDPAFPHEIQPALPVLDPEESKRRLERLNPTPRIEENE